MEATLKIEVQPPNEDYLVVKFDGEFDKAGHSEIREKLDSVAKDFDQKFLVFDFTRLVFINSEGIGYLMEIHTHLIKKDQKLVIIGLNDHVADVFKTIGISEIISIYDNLESFLNR